MKPAFVEIRNHPGFKDAEKECGGHAAREAAQEEDGKVVTQHGETCEKVQHTVEQTGALAAEAVREGTGKGGADAASGEASRVERGDNLLREVLLVLVDGIDVWTLICVLEDAHGGINIAAAEIFFLESFLHVPEANQQLQP